MEILRHITVFIHLIGFALLLGGWAVQAFEGKRGVTKVMNIGLIVATLAGLALAAPWGLAVGRELDYAKIGTKLVVLLIIGAFMGIAQGKAKKDEAISPVLFWGIGALTLANAAIAVLWS